MKKRIVPLLLLALLLTMLPVSALAAEPLKAGIYGITTNGVITPRTADDTLIEADDTMEGYTGFYADAVKFDVTCSGLAPNGQYLLLVLSDDQTPTDGNIVYINQAAADASGTVTYTGLDAAYPSSLTEGTYYVYVVGENKTFSAKTGAVTSFDYYQSYTLGDVTENGVIDTLDAAAAINHYLEKSVLSDAKFLAADVTKNGIVDTLDAAAMINHYLEKSLITE